MADIVFKYPEMRKAAEEIASIASQYKTLAGDLQTEFTSATGPWKGDSKDKMIAFMSGPVNDYTAKTIPQILTALSELLKANADQMESVDKQIAENIPTTLG